MSLRTPKLKELKTELISVMDYFNPKQPNYYDSNNTIRTRNSTTQGDEIRRAMTSNMFVELLEIIGNRSPSDIEASALILKEINNLLEEYETVIGPMINLIEGEESLISVVRQEVSDLTRNSFSGLEIPINTNEVPSLLKYSILSPFLPVARIKSINETGNQTQDDAFNNFVTSVWGSFNQEGFNVASQPNFVRDFESNISEFFFPFKYMLVLGDYLAQTKAIAKTFPEAFNDRQGSPHSYVIKKSIRSDEIGIIKPLMFDFTTSAAKSTFFKPADSRNNRAPLINKFITTDKGYETVFRESIGSSTELAQGTTNVESLDEWLNKPQNVLSEEVVSSLRDGFLSDTELAEELGLESSNLDPIQADGYVNFTKETNKERNDILSKIKQIIVNSELNSGVSGDFVPGISSEILIRGGSAFRNCNYIAIKEGLGNALNHQNCISLSGLFSGDLSTVLDRFQGAQRTFGKDWHLSSVREISKYLIGILTGRSTPRNTFLNPITGEVTVDNNADPSVEENLRRIDRINSSLEDLRNERSSLHSARSSIEFLNEKITLVNDFIGGHRRLSPLSIDDFTLVSDGSGNGDTYSSYVTFLFKGLISTGYSNWEDATRKFVSGNNSYYTINLENSSGSALISVASSKEIVKHLLQSDSAQINIKLLNQYALLSSQISNINDQIEELEQEIEEVRVDNVEFIINSLVNNFPFQNTLSIGRGIEESENVSGILSSPEYGSVVGFNDLSAIIANQVDYLDPDYEPRSNNTELFFESGFLSSINSVLTDLILDCATRISSIPVELNRTDILNYAYAYFMLAGAYARDGILIEINSNLIEDLRSFDNKITTPRKTVAVLASSEELLIRASSLAPTFQKNYSNSIGLGQQAPEGQIKDPYKDSLDYVKNLSDLLTQTLAPGFSVASEALLSSVQVLRRAFSRSVAIGGPETSSAINILDFILRTNDFKSFSSNARSFAKSKSLVPVVLLSSNDVTASFSLLQYALYVLTQSPITKFNGINVGSSKIEYNKVCSVGVHKNLINIIKNIRPSAGAEKIKRGFVKIQLLERQLDPSPSGIDLLLSNPDEFLEYGSKYLQSTPSYGQPEGGFNYYIGLKQDYRFLIKNFSLSNPVIKIVRDIVDSRATRREFEINLKTGKVNNILFEELEPEVRDGIITFIRSEALKIYYYYMTGLIFDPVFAPDPQKDDSIITNDLISSDPIKRLRSLLDLLSNSDINQFDDIILIPFISDNDSIEEFSAKIKFLT